MDGTSDITPHRTREPGALAEENARLRERIRELEIAQQKAGRFSSDLGDLDYTQVTAASLAEVIELMPVSAAVFDAEHRLVASNAAYQRAFSRLSATLRAGVTFEWILRRVVAAGWMPEYPFAPEDWIRKRLDEFNQDGIVDHKHHDGSMARVTVRSTADGGRLLLLADVTELEKERRARRETEERLHMFLENAPDLYWMRDARTNLPAILTPGFEKMWGIPHRADPGHSERMAAVVHPEDRARFKKVRRTQARRAGELEFRIQRPDGELRWLRTRWSPMKSADGQARYVCGVTWDVTEGKRQQQRAFEQAEFLSTAEEMAKIGHWFFDFETREHFWSDEVYRICGLEIGTPVTLEETFDRFHADDRNDHKKAIRRAIKGRTGFSGEYRVVRPDGELRHVHVVGNVSSGNDGPVGKIYGVIQDVTERKEAEAALRESEEKFRAAFEHSGVGMALVAPGQKFRAVNRALCELLGYTEAEMLEKTAIDVTHPAYVDELLEERDAILAGEPPRRNVERCLLRRDGEAVWTLLNRSRIEKGDGTFDHIIAQYQDITERKRAESALKNSEARLKDFAAISADRFWETDAEYRFTEFFLLEGIMGAEIRQQALGKTRWEWADADPSDSKWRRHIKDLNARLPFRNFRYSKTDGADGRTIHLRVSGQPVFDQAGDFVGYRGTTVDETAEVEARARAQDAQSSLYAAMDGAPQAIALWRSDERLAYCNDEYLRLYPHFKGIAKPGATVAQVLEAQRKANWSVVPDGLPDPLLEHWRTEHLSATDHEFELTNGEKWVRVRSRKLADGSSIKFHTDITANKRAEMALRESEELFRSSFEDTKVPTAIVSPEKRFLRTNRAFSKLIGYSKAELATMVPRDLVHPDDRERVAKARNLIVSGRRRAVKDEFRFIRAAGDVIWCQVNWTAILGAGGETVYWIAHYSDITEAKRAEKVVRNDHEILARVASGTPLPEVLSLITRSVEHLRADFRCAVMLYDRDVNALRIGNADSFTDEYRSVVKQLDVGPQSGSCGVAAYTRKRVIIDDLDAAGAATVRQHAAINMGLQSCVSEPILSSDKEVLGTLAVYSVQGGRPSRTELGYIASAASLAGIAIARERTMKEIQTAAEKVSGTIGDRYFQSLVQYLQETLGVDHAIVGKFVGPMRDRIQTIAVHTRGRLTENFEYELANSPCEQVAQQKPCFFPRGVIKKFPEDDLLMELGIEGYAGIPLKSSTGQVMGLLAVLSKTPLRRTEMTKSLLQIFAARAAAELERTGIESDLRASEARLRDFASSTADRFWETDSEHRIAYYSSSLDDRVRDPRNQVVGRVIWDQPSAEIDPAVLEDHLRTLAAREPFRDLRFVRLDDKGRRRHFRASGKPLFDESGAFAGYRGTSTDETDAIESQRQVESAQQRFLNALNNAPEGVTYWDADGRFVMSNSHFKRIMPDGWAVLAPGMTFEDYIAARAESGTRLGDGAEETAADVCAKVIEYFRIGHSEYEFSRGDRWFRNRIRRLEDGSTIMYLSEITEIRRREEEFRQALKMEAVGKLTGGVAHDFNNILAAALGNLELLQDDLRGDERMESRVARAIKAVHRGGDLTKRLLAFSRKQTLQPVPTDLRDLVTDTIDLLQRTLGEQVAIRSDFADDLWPVSVDRNQLENALVNLAINARDAMPNGGTLTFDGANLHPDAGGAPAIRGLANGDYVMLAVRDDGSGIEPDILGSVFDPFFTTKDVRQGSGLGLSQVYGFVKQSGGHVEIESEVGQGTTVRVYLPRAEADSVFTVEELEQASLPCGNGERVLVVEDDPEVREVTISILEGLGYRAIDGGDGSAFDTKFANAAGRVDLLLTDVILPGGVTGPEIADQVRAQSAETKILLMTGYAEGDLLLSDGAHLRFPLINKPFEVMGLARKLRELLEGGRVRRVEWPANQ